MSKIITPKELIDWVPGEVLSTSEALGWKDVEQRSYRYRGQDVLIPPLIILCWFITVWAVRLWTGVLMRVEKNRLRCG